MTTSEQQAVPVAQDWYAAWIAACARYNSFINRDSDSVFEAGWNAALASLPCKSGEGAGDREAIARIIRGHMPSHWCDEDALRTEAFSTALADAIFDATQTREAELVAAFRKAAQGFGRAGTADLPGGPDMSMDDAAEVYANLTANAQSTVGKQIDKIKGVVSQYREAPFRSADWLAGELLMILDTDPANDQDCLSPDAAGGEVREAELRKMATAGFYAGVKHGRQNADGAYDKEAATVYERILARAALNARGGA